MNLPDGRPVRAGFWAIILVGILAWAPATYPGYWQALDGFTPVFNVLYASPIAGVATAADLWRGTGSAAFILAQPLLLFGLTPVAATRGIFILSFLLGGLGVYTWLRPRYGDRSAGLAGLIYLFLPVLLSTVYIRGSVADAMVLALLPLALAAAAAYAGSESPAVAGLLLIAVIWLWRTQAGLALLASVLLVLYALLVERHRLTALVVVVAAVSGLLTLVPHLAIYHANPNRFADHLVYPFQLFGHGWQTAPSVPGWQDAYPFQLGLVAVLFSIVAFWLWRQRGQTWLQATGTNRLLWFSYAAILTLVVLASTVSTPLWALVDGGRLLSYPWQLLLLTAPLLAATAGSLPLHNDTLSRMPLWVVLLVVVVLSSYGYLTADFTQVTPPTPPPITIGAENNLAVLSTDLIEQPDGRAVDLTVTWQALQPLAVDYNIFFQAIDGADDAPTVVAQLDTQPVDAPAPAWRPGQILTATYHLDLPPDHPPLTYYFGFYDWRDGARLPVNSGLDDKLVFHGR